MELKKSKKADLQSKRGLFIEIGLIISLALVIGMFAVNFKERIVVVEEQIGDPGEEETVQVTMQDINRQPQRQQIQLLSEIINIVKDDTKITTEMKFDEFVEDAIMVPSSSNSIGNVVDFGDEIFLVVEDYPLFQGKNMNTFPGWVQEQINKAGYPEAARRANIQGRVQVRFVIEKDGTLTNIDVLHSPNDALSQAAVKAIQSSPKWTPGKQQGRPVRFGFTIPVNFRLRQ